MIHFDHTLLPGLWLSPFLIWLVAVPAYVSTVGVDVARAAELWRPQRKTAADFASPGSRTGVLVPLYIYPGPEWDRLVQAKSSYPAVPIVAVINPANGPGNEPDPNYLAGIASLRSVGILVLGYVYTSYAARSADQVMADVDAYRSWYPLDGLFLDEMSSLAGNEDYYAGLSDYARSLGYGLIVGNPATDTLPSYLGTVDRLVIYENAGAPPIESLGGWHAEYPKQNFALIAYDVSALDRTYVGAASENVGYLYLTDDLPPNPYDTLPAYFEELVAALNVNTPPVANNAFTATADTPLDVAAPGILGRDRDPDGDSITAVLVDRPAHGTLTLEPDGSFRYVPAPAFTGVDFFIYQVQDSLGARSNLATVTIQVVTP